VPSKGPNRCVHPICGDLVELNHFLSDITPWRDCLQPHMRVPFRFKWGHLLRQVKSDVLGDIARRGCILVRGAGF